MRRSSRPAWRSPGNDRAAARAKRRSGCGAGPRPLRAAHVLGVVARFDLLSTRFPSVASLPQAETEAVLAAVVADTASEVAEVTAAASARTRRPSARSPGRRGAADGASSTLAAPIVVLAGGWAARSLAYRDGRVPTTTYPDRYLMSDIAVPGPPWTPTPRSSTSHPAACSNRSPSRLRCVASWRGMPRADPDGRPRRPVRVARLQAGPAGSGRGIRRRRRRRPRRLSASVGCARRSCAADGCS